MELEDIILQYLENGKDAMKNLISLFLNAVMKEEAKIQVGAGEYERSDSRKAHRNGYRTRSLKTRYGTVTLNKPQIREFPFNTLVFDRYSRVEKATRNAIMESYIQGVSTRRIKDIVSNLGIENISATSVSNIAKELDREVRAFLNAPIEKEIRYLFIDATYFTVREYGYYSNQPVFIAIGVDKDGYRRVLGAKAALNESEVFWTDFFEEMKERGLRGVKLIISDGHTGIKSAVKKNFIGASWQMCHVHFIRTILSKTPKKKLKWVLPRIKEILNSEVLNDGISSNERSSNGISSNKTPNNRASNISDEAKLQELIEELEDMGLNKVARSIDKYRYDLFNYKAFPQSHWKRIRTTNVVERLNRELKRRGRVVGAFPSVDSLMRLLGSILINQNEEWFTGRRYLNMETEESPNTEEDPNKDQNKDLNKESIETEEDPNTESTETTEEDLKEGLNQVSA